MRVLFNHLKLCCSTRDSKYQF